MSGHDRSACPICKAISTLAGASYVPLSMRDAPHSGGTTSKDAAADIRHALPGLEARVLVWIAGRPDGATNEELESALGMPGNTLRPRVVELMARGVIRDSGRTRKTRSGRNARVVEIVK